MCELYFVSDQQIQHLSTEIFPISASRRVLAAICGRYEITLMYNRHWFFSTFYNPPILFAVEHVLDHLPFSCTVSAADAKHKGLTVLSGKVNVHVKQFAKMETFFRGFD
jgi:hypothetical protein